MSKLAPMRFKSFVWPHNPKTYTIDYERRMAKHDPPGRQRRLEVLGMGHRVMRGEGEFVGEGAYDTFKELACLFYEDTPGMLVHPVWQAVEVYFVELTLAQEPRANYVRYSFEFWECGEEKRAIGLKALSTAQEEQKQETETLYHTVVQGENLWAIGERYGVSVESILNWNPLLKQPNLIQAGQKVRVL